MFIFAPSVKKEEKEKRIDEPGRSRDTADP